MSCYPICSFTECLIFYVYLIVQAPVSDREYQATLPHTASMIDLAAKMISEGRGLELMPIVHQSLTLLIDIQACLSICAAPTIFLYTHL